MKVVPISPVASQTLSVTLGGQSCSLAIYQKSTGLFLDLAVAKVPLMTCVLCHDRVRLIRQPYLGLIGDLCFVDTQGSNDPVYTDLGTRYLLVYLSPGEYS